jgi:predicted SAM-dependent methyltransferase
MTAFAEAMADDVLAARRLDISQFPKPLKLDIGAGEFPRGEDFTTVDLHVKADIAAPMWALPIADNSVDEIWCSHALEHVAVADVHRTLKEWLRVLKPRARVIIRVPNFDYVARYWFTGPDRAWAEQMIFGLQTNLGEFHKSAWTAAVLKADLETAGFTVDPIQYRWTHNQETLQAVAHKPNPPQDSPV